MKIDNKKIIFNIENYFTFLILKMSKPGKSFKDDDKHFDKRFGSVRIVIDSPCDELHIIQLFYPGGGTGSNSRSRKEALLDILSDLFRPCMSEFISKDEIYEFMNEFKV